MSDDRFIWVPATQVQAACDLLSLAAQDAMGVVDQDDAARLASKLEERLSKKFEWADAPLTTTSDMR